MDDSALGTRNKRGDWTPNRRVAYGKVFVWPPQPVGFAKWLVGFPGYIWPWNLFYAGLAIVAWLVATPSMASTSTLSPGWIAVVLVRNAVLIVAWYGVFHLRLYMQRAQDTRFKYNGRWPAATSEYFTFKSQTKDNMFWTLASGLPMWTAYEVATLWMFGNGHLTILDFRRNPVWFVALMLLIPLFREFHFHWVHRMLHWPPMYKWVHSLHHRNTNPGPWSGLSMHPVEHLFYFTGVLFHWVLPSHPIHAMFHLLHAGMSPVPGHTGFDKVELGENLAFDTNCQAHYLHHKYFEVNYSDGSIPLDKWFGSFHDGSPEADEKMQVRLAARAAKAALAKASSATANQS
jgi:sterol desaturase/sphingolipid hydroxylase (fatty acid hydroxylase superfamily)